MADDHKPQRALLRLTQQEFPHLRLSDQVEHRGHLVAQHIARLRAQGARDTKALQLAA